MVTQAGTQNNLDDLVTSLLQLEKDAIEAYDDVIERLDDEGLSNQIAEFRNDHNRHVNELSQVAASHNIEIPDAGMKSMLTSGKVVMADIFGDKAILKAMKTNENDTVSAYENALNQSVCREEFRDICTRAHQDEIKHRQWMEGTAENLDRAA